MMAMDKAMPVHFFAVRVIGYYAISGSGENQNASPTVILVVNPKSVLLLLR